MTHGLYDSPFITRDIARHLLNRGFLVMCVLLPGHGTVPGDLLDIRYHEWVRAVDYGVEQIKQQAEQVYYAGFSMGATLMLHHAARNPNINALLLFAPALQLRADPIVTLLPFLKLIDWSSEKLKWYRRIPQQDQVKYSSFPFNGPYQIHCLIKEQDKLLAKKPFTTPIFLTMSSDDELIVPGAAVNLLAQNNNPHSKLLLYSNQTLTEISSDTRIEQRCSHFADLKIINFSHNCMAVAPDNPLYGSNSGFQDFLHYPGNKPLMSDKEVLLGSIRPENLVRANMQRLSYNPDFAYMMQAMDTFLDQIL